MKKYIRHGIVLLALVSFMISGCEKETGYSLRSLNLKGNVKSVHEISYEPVVMFGQMTKGPRSKLLPDEVLHFFNEIGLKTETRIIRPDGSYGRNVLEYDDNGKLFKGRMFLSENGRELLMYHYNYIHGESGKLIETVMHSIDGDSIFGRTVNIYGEHDRIIEEKRYGSGDTVVGRITFAYNEKGILETQIIYGQDNVPESTYNFDSDGHEQEMIIHQENSDDLKYYYIYEFDEKGNWTSRITYFYQNGKEAANTITERRIVYYK